MAIDIPKNLMEMIVLRQSLAPTVTLPPKLMDINRRNIDLNFEMEVKPYLTRTCDRPLKDQLSATLANLKIGVIYPISARLLSAVFTGQMEAGKYMDTALEGLKYQEELGTELAAQMYCHYFDISSGYKTAMQRIIIVDEELNGHTLIGIERRNKDFEADVGRLSVAELAEVYGDSIAYAREMADVLARDESDTPGTVLFTDLISRVESRKFVPGLLPESFPELLVLGIRDFKRVYEAVYPFSTQLLTSSK